jgi:hypothetical protein
MICGCREVQKTVGLAESVQVLISNSSMIRLYSLIKDHVQFLFECLRISSSYYWRYSNRITMMQRQLGDSQAMTHNSTFGQLLTHHKISGHLHTGTTTDYRWGNRPISRAYILSWLYKRKPPEILDKNVWTLWCKKRLRLQSRSMYCGQRRRLRVASGTTAPGPALEEAPAFRPNAVLMSLSSYFFR